MAITEPNKGRAAPLNRYDLVRRATAILDDYGIADLTMRRLARELDIAPSALYWHFANKQQLLGAVADHVLAPLAETDCRDVPWEQRIEFLCAALRDALLSHKDGAELVSASFASGQTSHMITVVNRLAEAAVTSGLGAVPAALAARSIVYYVLGYVADEQSRLQWDSAGALQDGQSLLADGAGLTDPTAQFGFGVRLLVDGIGQLARQSSPIS
ncbi:MULTISPECIES: TetR family transcriptional regulator [Mycobacteroides]|jgi:TetR/AcrR family tetracycline transcriptional repressor|uniref:TetR family transcriptional regulator n=1 Tax=Mycobacteroides chelonae TaxID=1774 RepID=A0AB73M0D3_MYCCH|nr:MULTISPECIES: TetR family transcriptional regulator [Mycobacteroides]KRQ22637.1 TetR family transcriptional regulator [Mycobacteroides sp. H072]KRQ40191.1 TetR family transcriptional regulator [Mycobacteroides sp. H002]KRQ47488.1 TetR family transcriptional regulator [Mycobacteroides sp. H054]KRQ70753.1 TetR family transcriptional regulator [Mycobacteroides sp. H001]MBF9326876.1 TetR family transcriptional regulator [Mycobacteroides chelonae]